MTAIRVYPPSSSSPAPPGGGFPDFTNQAIRYSIPVVGVSSLSGIGLNWTATATTAGAIGVTNYHDSLPKINIGGATGTLRGLHAQQMYNFGAGSDIGGFDMEFWFAWAGASSSVFFFGLYGAATLVPLSGTAPSALLNVICVGADAGDTQLQLIHNDNIGAGTKIALGAGFAKTGIGANPSVARLRLTATANAGTVDYTVENLITASTVSGTISTNISTGTYHSPQFAAYHAAAGSDIASFLKHVSQSPPRGVL